MTPKTESPTVNAQEKNQEIFFCDCTFTRSHDLYSSILCHLSHSALTYASGVRLI